MARLGPITLCAFSMILMITGAAVGQEDSLPPTVTREMVEIGRELFRGPGNCWACHGEDAQGARGVGPDLTDDEWWHVDGSYDAIIRRIMQGVSADSARNRFGAMMPPRGGSSLTDQQVRAVAAYVWSLSRPGAFASSRSGHWPR